MKYAIFVVLFPLLEITYGYSRGWEKDVQKCRDGVHKVLQKFPEPTYKEGETIWAAFYQQTEELKVLANSTSPILKSNAVSILETLGLLANADRTPTNVLYQLKRVYPAKQKIYRDITSNSTKYIGNLNKPIIASIDDIATSILSCLKQFNRRYAERRSERCEKIDFKGMVRSVRLNTNIIAFIDGIAVQDTFADETYETVGILSLISCLLLLSVHGTNGNMGTVLHNERCDISPTLRACFNALDPIVDDTTKLITKSSFSNVNGIKQFLGEFGKLIPSYNRSLEKLLGPFEGVGITEAQVKANLKK
ncbi:uncharacterized protein LOC119071539 isoform X2 [Bradysia coprophila]|uniref:uncharacterized protein LOC119071539 isoform X1 n=1 Tax=Bradysia coprophila TaxID=38358 RepID=UPI00187DCBAB|nr:uncharacterized protein LOC119071539 isoform X1 [Bradysia coprophila]XP_037032335.1 uncharacterized protein LOC119071539 isoform X2 [Bradysia coprophila]